MTYALRPRAKADFRSIAQYSIEQWGSERARTYIEAINQRLVALAAGQVPARSAHFVRQGYLMSPVGRHMIYFRRNGDGRLDVIRILHQSMNVAAQLAGDT